MLATEAAARRPRDLFALKLFSRVARLGSFSAAARELGISQSQASRIVSELEAGLGGRLLRRTTRAVATTEAGTEYLSRIESILDALEEADEGVREGGEFRGRIRISMPTSVAVREIIPRLAGFADRHPRLHLQVLLDDRKQDLVREAVDVAIRLGRLSDATGTAKTITRISRVIVAAPAYLARHGTPVLPEDLMRHRIVDGPAARVPTAWSFERGGDVASIQLTPCMSSDDNEGAVAAAAAGLGITSTTFWGCRRELTEGSLVRLLTDWRTADTLVHAYYPMGRTTPAAARALMEYLASELGDELHGSPEPSDAGAAIGSAA